MAMNKKEKAEMEELQILCAFKRTSFIGKDVPYPLLKQGLVRGFSQNTYTGRAIESASSAVNHSMEKGSSSRGAIEQYSTRLRALKAMRFEVEQITAKRLYSIDLMIEDEITQGNLLSDP